MGLFSTKKSSSPRNDGRKSRYTSPQIETSRVASDLSKNKLPSSPIRPTTFQDAPYGTPTAADRPMVNNGGFFTSTEEAPPPEVQHSTTTEDHVSEDEDDEHMVIKHPAKNARNDKHDDVSDVQGADTADEEVGSTNVYDVSRNTSQMNSLFNGHLMKWRYDSTEGPGWLRIPAFFAGLGLISTTTAALIMYPVTWTISSIVISVFVYIIAITVVILDGRFLSGSPLSFRAHLRNIVTRHFGIFRYLWGRGVLYLAGGVLSASLVIPMTMISGAVMLLISILATFVGMYSSRKYATLKHSLADDSFLLLEFSHHDSDDDGYIDPSEFANLLHTLGMELDDRYCLKAFNSMDTDHDRRVSFEEFCHWWTQGYIERGRKAPEEDDSYHRFA